MAAPDAPPPPQPPPFEPNGNPTAYLYAPIEGREGERLPDANGVHLLCRRCKKPHGLTAVPMGLGGEIFMTLRLYAAWRNGIWKNRNQAPESTLYCEVCAVFLVRQRQRQELQLLDEKIEAIGKLAKRNEMK
jgi:hypothetical protein